MSTDREPVVAEDTPLKKETEDDAPKDVSNSERSSPQLTSETDPKSPPKSPVIELDPNSDDPMKMPPHGTEVYIGGITKTATEAQIREFCEQRGEVFQLRCPKDLNLPGQNRGYAFVTYTTREAAHDAVNSLNQTEMKDFPEKKVCLLLSQVKNRLFLGNIPREITKDELRDLLEKEVVGIVDVELVMDFDHIHNRGFCFLECYNHAAADIIRQKLCRPDFKIKDRNVTITWAEPRKVDSDHERVRSVYVGNLPESATESKLKDIFKAYGNIEKVVLLPSRDGKSQRDYGFVHYVDRSCALKAVEAAELNPISIDDQRLQVSVARPSPREDYDNGSNRRMHRSRSHGDYRDPYGSGYNPSMGYNLQMPYGNMALVPTFLPNGQVGYVFQQAPAPGGAGPVPMGRAMRPYGYSSRYRPY